MPPPRRPVGAGGPFSLGTGLTAPPPPPPPTPDPDAGTGTGTARQMVKVTGRQVDGRNVVLYADRKSFRFRGVRMVKMAPGTGSGGWEYVGTGTGRRRVVEYGECIPSQLGTGTGSDVTGVGGRPDALSCCRGKTWPPRLYLFLRDKFYPCHSGVYPLDWRITETWPWPGRGYYVYDGPCFAKCQQNNLVEPDKPEKWCTRLVIHYLPCTKVFSITAHWAYDGLAWGTVNPFLSWRMYSHLPLVGLSVIRGQCDPWYEEWWGDYFNFANDAGSIIWLTGFELAIPNVTTRMVITEDILGDGFFPGPGTGTGPDEPFGPPGNFTGTGTGSTMLPLALTPAPNQALEKLYGRSIAGRAVALRLCTPTLTGTGSGSLWPFQPEPGTGTGTGVGGDWCEPDDPVPAQMIGTVTVLSGICADGSFTVTTPDGGQTYVGTQTVEGSLVTWTLRCHGGSGWTVSTNTCYSFPTGIPAGGGFPLSFSGNMFCPGPCTVSVTFVPA